MTTQAAALPSVLHLTDDTPRAARHDIRRVVTRAIDDGQRSVSVDCSGVMELDLLVLSALLRCAEECSLRQARLELVNVEERLRARIERLGLLYRLGL